MITQMLLDLLATILAGFISLLPPMPAEFAGAVSGMAAQGAALAPSLASLGPVFPFEAVATVLALFPVAVTLWVALLAVRLVLWAIAR